MVSRKEKPTPTYNLEECKSAVRQKKYRLSRSAEAFITDFADSNPHLVFDKLDFEMFVQSLSASDFKKSIRYDEKRDWMDVYKSKYELRVNDDYESENTIPLYFKFCMLKERVFLQTISFHGDR